MKNKLKVKKTIKNHDHINHLELRSDIENDNIVDCELKKLQKELSVASMLYSTSKDINKANKANYDMMIISDKIKDLKEIG